MTRTYFIFIIGLTILLFSTSKSFSQNLSITIVDKGKNELLGATVQLVNIANSDTIYRTSDKNGNAIFNNINDGLYGLKISYIGFEDLNKSITVNSKNREFKFKLKENAITLGEVTIKARTPLIRQEDDKMIIDPANLIDISSNTLEVLESVPGMYVDQDGGIFLNSATPAKVYINGREQKMSNQDISTILLNLPPGSVQKIEVMRTPSTKYDASSSGGIVNIVLKKGVKIGRFGSVTAGFSQSHHSNGDIGFTINDSGEKTTGYLNAKYRLSDREEVLNVNRFMQTDTFLYQNAKTRRKSHRLYTGYGVSYDFNENLNLSYDGRLNYNDQESSTANSNYSETIDIIRLSQNDNTIINNTNYINIQQDLSLNLKLDTIGSEWDTKFGYNYSDRKNLQDYDYIFTIPESYTITGGGEDNQLRHFISLQSDFTRHFPYKIKLETGVKSSYQKFDSDGDFSVNYAGVAISDPIRTNSFNYSESINATYLQVSKTLIGNFILKGGVRMEHTYMEGKQTIPTDTSFLINRADWFPYVYLSRTVFKMNDFELNGYAIYRRTISRPGYQMLNPNINFVDQFMYETGNPALKPQFTNNIELNISYKDTPVFAVGQNYTTDIFSGVMYQSPSNPDIAVRTYDNLGKSKETYFKGIIGIPPGGRYFFAAGAQYNYNEYDGFYENEPLQYTHGSWRFFTFHMLKLFGNTKLTASGFMMVNGRMDFYELENFGSINIGLRQSFLDGRLNVSIKARDILKTMIVSYEINQGSIHAWGDRYTDNRRFGINIRYSFGFGKKKEENDMFNMEGVE